MVSSGVKRAEIHSRQFGRIGKLFFYVCLFILSFAYTLDATTRNTYQTTAASALHNHSLVSTVNVARGVVGAATRPAIARLSDIFGRGVLLASVLIFFTVGTIVQSQATTIGKFAGGAILYQVGYTGLTTTVQVITSDFSLLNWRLLGLLVPTMPSIINTWISGDIASAMVSKWQWGFGMWAIIVPVCSLPVFGCLIYANHQSKDEEMPISDFKKLGLKGFLIDLFWKLDVIGNFFLAASLALVLVPLTLAGGESSEWKQAKIIAPLVIGFVLFPVYIVWELHAKYPITPFKMLKDRGVWSALILAIMHKFIYYMQGGYMYTVLLVAMKQSVKAATRITKLYTFVGTITGSILGLLVVRIRRLKAFIIFGTVMWIVAMGILIHYRGGLGQETGVIGALCLMGFGAGLYTHPAEASLQATTNHEHMAVITALNMAVASVGDAFGNCVAGAIWTQMMPKELAKGMDSSLVSSAYNQPLQFIKKYAWGTPERDAMVEAYRAVEKVLTITGTCLCIPLIAGSLFIRDHYLESKISLHEDDEDSENEKSTEREDTPSLDKENTGTRVQHA